MIFLVSVYCEFIELARARPVTARSTYIQFYIYIIVSKSHGGTKNQHYLNCIKKYVCRWIRANLFATSRLHVITLYRNSRNYIYMALVLTVYCMDGNIPFPGANWALAYSIVNGCLVCGV